MLPPLTRETLSKIAAAEFQPTAKQGKAWGGKAAFRRAAKARKRLQAIRKANPELTAQQAFKQLRAGSDRSLFRNWTKEDMNLFIDRYVTNDPHQAHYYNHGKLFSNKKGQLFNRRSALDEDMLIDKPFGQTAATVRSGLASLGSGIVGGATFVPELAWSGVKTLAGGLTGKGWHWRSTDWNPLDNLNVDSSIADYKTAGKAIQRGVNTAADVAGMAAATALSGGVGSGSAIGKGTKGAFNAAKKGMRYAKKTGGSVPGAFFKHYGHAVTHNAKQLVNNTHSMLKNPIGAIKSAGTDLRKNFKKSPWSTAGGVAMSTAFGPGAVAYGMLSGPAQPMNDYFAGSNTPRLEGAVNAEGTPVGY